MKRGQKASKATGGVIFVQVKCGGNGYRQDQNQHPNHIGINLGEAYIVKHRPRWNLVPGPAVLIFVNDTIDHRNPPCWWVNIKDDESYSKTNKGQILIPKNQKFGSHSKGIFHKLCGSGPTDRNLPTISISRNDDLPVNLSKNESLRNDAWEYYKEWSSWPENETTKALKNFGLTESTQFPLKSGAEILTGHDSELRLVCEILENWRFWLVDKWCQNA